MAPEVKKETPAVIADNNTGDVFHIVFIVAGKQLEPFLAFANGEPFFEVVGAERSVEVAPFLRGVRGFLAVDDETAECSYLMCPVVIFVVRIVAAGKTGGEQEAGVEAIFVVLHGVVFLIELVQVGGLGAGGEACEGREGGQHQQGEV